jgi:hypothetical protein
VVLHEHEQQIKGARTELGGPPFYREQAFRGIEIEAADADPVGRVRR